MAMLDRYRKTGGFNQLLNLLETCEPAKQEKFLTLVRSEDPRWAKAIDEKMIDMNRIYTWNDETFAEIVGALQDLTVAVLLHDAPPQVQTRINACYSPSQKRRIESLFETTAPTKADISAARVKVIETVRKMAKEGKLRFDKIDPVLYVQDDIEDRLAQGSMPTNTGAAMTVEAPRSPPRLTVVRNPEPAHVEAKTEIPEAHDNRIAEINALKKKVSDLSRENAGLRHELSLARAKLEQIRRIA